MSRNEVDSTVLLLAVIAGVVALLLIPPGQIWLCGVAGLILLITLFAFDLEGVRSVLQSFAFAAVCGFSLAVAIAPLAPTLVLPDRPDGSAARREMAAHRLAWQHSSVYRYRSSPDERQSSG